MMKQFFNLARFNLGSKIQKSIFYKSNNSVFSTDNSFHRTLDLEKSEKIPDILKHQKFVI